MKKVLLIRPKSNIPVSTLPLGLMYIASICRKDHAIKILDLRQKKEPVEKLKGMLKEFEPDIVGIGCMSAEARSALKIAEIVKEYNRKIKVVIGGPHTSTFPKETLANPCVDILLHGEGEYTFLDVVNGILPEKIKGISYKKGGEIFTNLTREFIQDLDSLPFPAYDLIDMQKHFDNPNVHGFVLTNKRHAQIFTSRGCPFNCIYCHNVFGKKFRARSPENVLEEIELLYNKYGVKEIHIEDDAFNVDINRAKKIMDLIAQSKMNIKISFPNGIRADLIDEELAKKMKMAGVYQISLGIESGDFNVQKKIKKGLNLEKVNNAINLLTKHGMIVNGFFMIGFLDETKEQINRTIDFLKNSKLHFATIHKVSPFPGTELYDEANKYKGLKIDVDDIHEDEYRFGESNISAVSLDELRKLQKKAYFKFYFNPIRLWRIYWLAPNKFTLIKHFFRLLLWK